MHLQPTVRRLLLLAALLWAVPATAQQAPVGWPAGVSVPVFVIPASAVNGAGVASGPIYFPDGTAAAPSITFASQPAQGLFTQGLHDLSLSVNGVTTANFNDVNGLGMQGKDVVNVGKVVWGADTFLTKESAAVLQMGSDAAGVTNQMFKGPDRITTAGVGGNLTFAGGRGFDTGLGGSLIFQTAPAAGAGVAGILATALTIDAAKLATFAGSISPTVAQATIGSGVSSSDLGSVRRLVSKYSVTSLVCVAPFQAASTTADCVIATLPVKTRLVAIYADTLTGWTCSGTCTGTKTMGVGKSAGGVEYLKTGLDVAATGQWGIADADMGSEMTRAAKIQDSALVNWAATIPVTVRFTSGTGNWGSGGATYVNAGATTFYLVTESLP